MATLTPRPDDPVTYATTIHVTVDVLTLCGGFDRWNALVTHARYRGERVRLHEFIYSVDWVSHFDGRRFCRWLEVEETVSGTFPTVAFCRGDMVAGLLWQLAGGPVSCELSGQGGELVEFELPPEQLPEFNDRLARLLDKLREVEFTWELEDE